MTVLAVWLSALWLGIVTSVSPCPLATNVAAVSYLARRTQSRRRAALGAIAYALGRASVYTLIGLLVALGLAAAPELSAFMQRQLLPYIGPLLIIVGLVLIGWLPFSLSFGVGAERFAQRIVERGPAGEFLLGALFALTFCPVSAALFFGTLVPLALASPGALGAFVIYGLGTALPVGLVAMLFVLGVRSAAGIIGGIQRWQGHLQSATASIIIAVGVYMTLSGPLDLI